MRVGVDEVAPLIRALGRHIVIAVALDATPAHPNMFVDGVIGSVDRNASELARSHASHDMATLALFVAHLQARWIILRVAGEATELSCKEKMKVIEYCHQEK